MLFPLLAGAAVLGVVANRRRIKTQVEREYAARFSQREGVAEGSEGFTLKGTNGCGVLILHGSGDSPLSLRYLAGVLNDAGYSVSAPLLPGHGRSPSAFAGATADDYADTARKTLGELRKENHRIAIVGLSMGAAIASRLCAEEHDVRALVLLAPYLVPPPTVRRIAATRTLWGLFAPYLKGRGEESVFDPAASQESRAYGTFSPGALKALVESAALGLDAVARLTLPVQVINSDRDNRIPRESAEQALRAFRIQPEIHWVSGCGHVITIDYCKETVARLTREFLDRHAS